MFKAVYVNIDECYGPEGSLPLAKALQDLIGTEEVSTYRGDGFVTLLCPVTDEFVVAHHGSAVALNSDGAVIVLEQVK